MLAWREIVRDTKRLDLTHSDSVLAEAKLREAKETTKARLREYWCYLVYPFQETAQSEGVWMTGKVPAQDGLLSRTSKKTAYEALRFGVDMPEEIPMTTTKRAYISPIWYTRKG